MKSPVFVVLPTRARNAMTAAGGHRVVGKWNATYSVVNASVVAELEIVAGKGHHPNFLPILHISSR